MSKQKRHVLLLETSVDFELIGICSHHSDYRLAWGINKILGLELTKSEEPLVIQSKKGTVVSQHSFHVCFDEVDHMEWYLIKNKSEWKFLIPEKSQIDYFLILRDNVLHDLEDIADRIRESNSVMAAYVFEASTIPSAELIIFE
ncbi:IPExxxVDY family protein [Fluviicola sp.]|jgi:hypothetical protein|uniref:IPExxxVDY family protein n=1 Tax=Fluviicola sp. TaxID=1917219 RepID=UPI00281C44A1|nr:IPExxxVDY family protein [Fluviicola sp.]MDR0801403.1 IPExxxVDY family protein [Fluviicola sp.]